MTMFESFLGPEEAEHSSQEPRDIWLAELHTDFRQKSASDTTTKIAGEKECNENCEKALADFASKHQIEVKAQEGFTSFHIRSAGKDTEVFRQAGNLDLVAAERKVKELLNAKEAQLKADYGLRFSEQDEPVIGKVSFDEKGGVKHGAMVHARSPYLNELYEIETVMERAAPSNLLPGSKTDGVKFYFLNDSLYESDPGGTIATYVMKDKQETPAVYISPGGIGARLEIKDGKMAWHGSIDDQVVLHELGHNTALRLLGDSEEKLIQLSNRCGFDPFDHPVTGETIWAIKGKNGELFRLVDRDSMDWARIDRSGNLLDGKGNSVTEMKLAENLSTEQMRERALVKPPTFYFDNPLEAVAEGLSLLRRGAATREAFMKDSPQMYDYIKELDQADIDSTYGTASGGGSKMVRLPSGRLAVNDSSSQRAIAEFEGRAK